MKLKTLVIGLLLISSSANASWLDWSAWSTGWTKALKTYPIDFDKKIVVMTYKYAGWFNWMLPSEKYQFYFTIVLKMSRKLEYPLLYVATTMAENGFERIHRAAEVWAIENFPDPEAIKAIPKQPDPVVILENPLNSATP